ncbi:uncharacterized protein LOC143036917 [Oratosquilla oratoria]|uniref:uncharacterized protein LOC143036917 n=1 Tax=Oratosquilla oratoria TaxID=337810 RepID=UPI003F76CCF1
MEEEEEEDVGPPGGVHEEEEEEEGSVRDKLLALFSQGDAASTLDLLNASPRYDPLLLWVVPQRCCLDAVADHVRQYGLSCVASVGCGSGLLEWLMAKMTGIDVEGYEVNKEWWTSRYAPPVFLPHKYADPNQDPPTIDSSAALMCCYFNGGDAFRKYVEAYAGPLLIIIGSVGGPRHTDPGPLDYAQIDARDTQLWWQEEEEEVKEDEEEEEEGTPGHEKIDSRNTSQPHGGPAARSRGGERASAGAGPAVSPHRDIYNDGGLGRGPWKLTRVHRMTEFDMIGFYVRS